MRIPRLNQTREALRPKKPEIRSTVAIKSRRQLEDALRNGSFYVEDNHEEKHYDIYVGKTKTGSVELIGSIPYPIEDEVVVQTSGMEGEDKSLSLLKAGTLAVFRDLLQKKRLHSGIWGRLSRAVSSAAINHNPEIICREEV